VQKATTSLTSTGRKNMECINVKKFQNMEGRGPDGRLPPAATRRRLPDSCFERMDGDHAHVLHPTKGWRKRNTVRAMKHGELQMYLDQLAQQARHRMLLEREDRKKLKAKQA
jgi:hypothetical protein